MKNISFKYLDANTYDKEFGLWVNDVGFETIEANTEYPLKSHPHKYYFNPQKGRILNEYQLVFISKGEGLFTSNNHKNIQVKQGKLIFLFPDQWHTYYPIKKKGWDCYYIGFNGPTIVDIISKLPIAQENQILDIGINEELEVLFKQALEAAEIGKQLTQQYLSGVVMHMIGLIISYQFNIGSSNEMSQKINSAISTMIQNTCNRIDIPQIANDLNLSYSLFRKEFKKQTGLPPNQYFQNLRLKEAKKLLYSSDSTIKDICFELGYNSPEHFISIFKKNVGKTPSEYRRFSRGKN